MALYVFEVGSGYYEIQCIVVAATSEAEARAVLTEDRAARIAAFAKTGLDDSSSEASNMDFGAGFSPSYHGTRIDKFGEPKLIRTVDGPVAYTYGVDG